MNTVPVWIQYSIVQLNAAAKTGARDNIVDVDVDLWGVLNSEEGCCLSDWVVVVVVVLVVVNHVEDEYDLSLGDCGLLSYSMVDCGGVYYNEDSGVGIITKITFWLRLDADASSHTYTCSLSLSLPLSLSLTHTHTQTDRQTDRQTSPG